MNKLAPRDTVTENYCEKSYYHSFLEQRAGKSRPKSSVAPTKAPEGFEVGSSGPDYTAKGMHYNTMRKTPDFQNSSFQSQKG